MGIVQSCCEFLCPWDYGVYGDEDICDRCCSLTKSGYPCLNYPIKGRTVCASHKRSIRSRIYKKSDFPKEIVDMTVEYL